MEKNNEQVIRCNALIDKIKNSITLLNEIDEMIRNQSTELSKVDSELSDWYHLIENNKLTPEESSKVIERIQQLRLERRDLNNEYEIENVYQQHKSKLAGNETRQFLLIEIHKAERKLNQEYKNRVLTDEMINELLEKTPKKKRGRPKKNTEEVTKNE